MANKCLNAPTPIRFLKLKMKEREAVREKLGLVSKEREMEMLKKQAKEGTRLEKPLILGTKGLDLIEIVSNGIYSSVEHRVTVNPKMDSEIGLAPSLGTPDAAARFKRVSMGECFSNFYAHQLKGKSYPDVMRINHK